MQQSKQQKALIVLLKNYHLGPELITLEMMLLVRLFRCVLQRGSGLATASRNAADAQSMLDTAEGAMQETHSVLLRMRELAVQGANGTLTSSDLSALDAEFQQLEAEVDG